MMRYLAGILCIFLAGCGGIGDVTTPPPPLTLRPLPTAFVSGSCQQTSEFESWLQRTSSRLTTFAQLVEDSANKSREVMFEDTRQMERITEDLIEHGVIDCATETFDLMIDAMRTTTANFQQYVNAGGNVEDVINQARITFQPVNAAMDELVAQLEDQFGR